MTFRYPANAAAFESVNLVYSVAVDLEHLFPGLETHVSEAAMSLFRADAYLDDGTVHVFLRLAQGLSFAVLCR